MPNYDAKLKRLKTMVNLLEAKDFEGTDMRYHTVRCLIHIRNSVTDIMDTMVEENLS